MGSRAVALPLELAPPLVLLPLPGVSGDVFPADNEVDLDESVLGIRRLVNVALDVGADGGVSRGLEN